MQAFPGDAWLSTSLLHDAVTIQSPTHTFSHPFIAPSIHLFLCEALVCPKLQMHTAGYQHHHFALSRCYACSDAMIASVLIGINLCTAFAAGQVLPFYMKYFLHCCCMCHRCRSPICGNPSIYAEASAHVAILEASCETDVGTCRCTTPGRFLTVSASSWLGWWRHCLQMD